MKTTKLHSTGHSADVRMQLFVDGHVLSIGQLGLGFMILENPTDHGPMEAEVAMSVDGRESRWTVHLPDGISSTEPHTRITSCQ
jgi:hypothetical protein